MSRYSNFKKAEMVYGMLSGEQINVCRVGATSISYDPNFTVQNQTPNTVATYKYYIETITSKYAQINAPDVEWYTVKGFRGVLRTGDVLQYTRIPAGEYSTSPVLTIASMLPFGIVVGFKTTRVGAIYNGDTLLYSGIMYDYLPRSAFPGTPLDREVEASLGVPSIQAVMFKRNLYTTTQDGEGLFLYQTDTNPVLIWQITDVTELQAGNGASIQILNLKRNVQG